MNDSVLVTGGSGFIGTWVLRELLSRGLQPVAFDLQRNTDRWQRVMGDTATDVSFVAGSLLDRELLQRTAREQRVSHIIHLAALLTPQCQQNPFAGCEINVQNPSFTVCADLGRVAGNAPNLDARNSEDEGTN